MLFIGKQEKGYFIEEYAQKTNKVFEYIETNPHIDAQINEILSHGKQDFTIFDIEQYIDEAENIAQQIERICKSNNSKAIIYASGYRIQSDIICSLANQGLNLFILSSNLSGMKDQLEKCINGYYEANGIEELNCIKMEKENEEVKRPSKAKLIGVCGACKRIGTTTHAVQIVRYLQLKGYKACYIQLNRSDYVKKLTDWYEVEILDNATQMIEYSNVEHFGNADKIQEILKLDYDFFVYDYGVNSDVNFNRLSFTEKDIKIFVLGSEPDELELSYDIVKSVFYDDVYFIFNFVSKSDAENIKILMDEKMDKTFIAEFIPDKYVYVPTDMYEKIIPVEDRTIEGKDKKRKWKGLFGKK